MSWVEKRKRAGGRLSYRVRWRTGGRAEAAVEVATFYEEDQAKDFKLLVDRAEQQWPPDEALRAFGFHDLCSQPDPEAADEPAALMSCGQYFEAYVEALMETQSVKGYERKKYRQRLRDHVIPYIGDIPIAALTKADLRRWQNALATKGGQKGTGLGNKTILNVRGSIVAPALACSCDPDNEFDLPKVRDNNPLVNVRAPKKRRLYKPIIEDEVEAGFLIQGMYATGNRCLGDLITSVLCGSLRLQEAVALPVGAVNLRRRVNTVYQVMSRPEDGPWVIVDETKTDAGFRENPIPDEQLAMYTERCQGRPANAIVFVGPTGGHWRYTTLYDWWRKGVKLAQGFGLNKTVTMRELRHSGLSRWREDGMDLEAIRQLGGHESIATASGHYFGRVSSADMQKARTAMSPIAAAALKYRAEFAVVPAQAGRPRTKALPV